MTDQLVTAPVVEPVTPVTPAAPVTPVVAPIVEPVAPPAAPVVAPIVENKAWFPDDWAEKMANGDEKELARLKRHPDPSSVWKSYRELENKISTGTIKLALPDNATNEQVQQYRKDNGIPETADGYELKLADGLTIGEQDEPMVNAMLENFLDANLPPAIVNKIVNGYFEARAEEAAQLEEQQKVIRAESEETLRAKWGGNYQGNIGAIKNLLSTFGDVGEDLMAARMPDGSLVGNNAQAVEALARLALDLNPAGTVVPGATGNQVQAIQQEIDSIEKLMKTNIHAYRADKNLGKRLNQLYDARLKLNGRGVR